MKKTLLAALSWLFLGLSLQAQTQVLAPMPPHVNVYLGNVRGYWFTAPSCFTITGLQLPPEAGGGAQSIAVLRFPAIPPTYSTTTNTFETLFLTQNNANTGILPTNIQVEQGDIIGILGQAGTTNSYGNGTLGTTIEGFVVPLSRLGMQFSLTTTAPQQIWTEASTNISRVNLYYDSLLTFTANHVLVSGSTFDFSSNADTSFSVAWDFGDGSPLVVADSATYTYASSGIYNACAYVTTTCGTDTVCTTVTVCMPAVAGFGVSTTGMDITISDSTVAGDSVTWDFGDGNFGSGFNVTHSYAMPDTYTVCQIVTNFCSADTLCQTVVVCTAPTAGFNINSNFMGTVVFADGSTYGQIYAYDFGDGSTDTTANPTHTYSTTGTYTICLVVSNFCGADTFCQTINACATTPLAAFSSTDSLLTVTFNNSSSNSTTYSWDFGDGSTDTTANPVHTYAADGSYVVCLSAFDICGGNLTVCDTITVTSVSITGALPGFSVQVVPNPMTDYAQVLVQTEGLATTYAFTLTDLTGRVVATLDGNTGEVASLVRNGWASGMYTFKVVSEGKVLANGRLIVQ